MADEEKDEIFPADAASSDEEVASAAYIEEGPEQENEDNAEGQEESEAKNKGEKKKGRKRNFKFRLRNPLPIIDRYILGKFLGTYFLATILLLLVIAMFDITEKLDAFLTAPLKETLFDYFASFLPYFANQLSPLFVFISVIFFTTKLADNSEIIAMLSSGITFRRLLRPYMIGAAIIAALTFALSNYIIPPTNVNRIAYTNKYVKNKAVAYGTNIQLMVRPGEVAYFGRFDNTTKQGYRFSLDKFDGKSIVSRLTASSVEYDTTRQYHWKLKDYMIRDFDGMNEKIRRGSTIDSIIPIEPKDFLIASNDQEMLTTPQLTDYIRKQKMRGVANIKKFEIEREKRLAETAAAFILTLIGMSLSSKKVKGGMGINIGIGLGLSFSYILFSTITSSFAVNGYTSPAVAMEIPNIVYLIIGIILYRRASKF
ncbi:MAG: LptF/LptG family permease [Muribaculaceae bacterium]|nr:LptF/LptG family permease [Muribaculaceae bacterium]